MPGKDLIPQSPPGALANLPERDMTQAELDDLFQDGAALGSALPWSRVNRKLGTIQLPDETGALYPSDAELELMVNANEPLPRKVEQVLIVTVSPPRKKKVKDPDSGDDEAKIVTCSSPDGQMPLPGGEHSGPCSTCPAAQFDKNGGGSACRQSIRLLLRDASGVLYLMQFSGLAVKPTKTLLSGFRLRNRAYFERFLSITLVPGKDGKGRPTYLPQFKLGDPAPAEVYEECKEIAKAYRSALRNAVDTDAVEVNSDDTDAGAIEVKASPVAPDAHPPLPPPPQTQEPPAPRADTAPAAPAKRSRASF